MTKSRLYTRTGDKGTTSLVDGSRISKDAPRLEAYGTVDELNSFIGQLLATAPLDQSTTRFLLRQQNALFDIGGYLATDPVLSPELARKMLPDTNTLIEGLEAEIDRLDALVPPLHSFVLPSGAPSAAAAHVCRAVCRRAERRIIALSAIPDSGVDNTILTYINRLSDYFFVLARFNNQLAQIDEIFWSKER